MGDLQLWYVDFINYLVTKHSRKSLENRPCIICAMNHTYGNISRSIIEWCILETISYYILTFCHSCVYKGHFGAKRNTLKVLESGFYWHILFKDAYIFWKACDDYQWTDNIGLKDQMPLILLLLLKFILFGEMILWDILLPLMVVFIFYSLLIKYLNRWRLKTPKVMTLKWL